MQDLLLITKHFIGNLSHFQEKSSEVLLNLSCPTLQDFRWYKDVFLTRIYFRIDCNHAYWKEKFLSGLPKLFVENARERIRQNVNVISYLEINYGELINYIHITCLALCTDLNLKAKIGSDQMQSKRDL